MRLLVAIPCLNEEDSIQNVIERIPRQIDSVDSISVLVIDDGSTDATVEVAKRSGAAVIQHYTNYGVGYAFNSALNYAIEKGYDIMVNIDGDGQFDPADIPRLVQPIVDKMADFVTGSRFFDRGPIENMSKVKLYGNYAMSYLIGRLCQQKFKDVSCGFRAYSRETLLNLNLHAHFTYTQETFLDLSSKSIRIVEVPIQVKYFKDRQSRVARSIWDYFKKTSSIILTVYRDYYPMRFFGNLSALSGLIALLFGLLFFWHFYNTGQFSGYLFAGFLSGFFIVLSLVFALSAVAMDMLVRIRKNQEKMLYLIKKKG
ncbi:MAG: glycosyltransferase family 2 protein [Solirubrobacterales bacterium]